MSYRLTKIYTRSGDDGQTNLGTGERFPKNHPRIEALGALDELNSTIGLILSQDLLDEDIYSYLTQIQHELFNIGGELCPPYHSLLTQEKILFLENKIDEWNQQLPPLKEFILPRGNFSAAACHLARAVCRRAERCLVALAQQEPFNTTVLCYINRLSDFLFVAARILAKASHEPETLWQHQKKNKQ